MSEKNKEAKKLKRPSGLDSGNEQVDSKRIRLETEPSEVVDLTRDSSSDVDNEPEQEGKNGSADSKKIPSEDWKIIMILCVPAPIEREIQPGSSSDSDRSRPADVAHAQVATDKLWPKNQDVLKVYFLNPSALQSVGLNELNIMQWANLWETSTNKGIVPRFEPTGKKSDAKIRVEIKSTSGSWSKIGVAAESVDPDDPTMVLGLRKGSNDYNQHTTVHEFGHALGLLHEHQRSKFWSIADKFIDKVIMKGDPRFKGINLDDRYFEAKQSGAGSEDYDPDSVMHYWFDKAWLKEERYRDIANVQSDKSLSEKERKVLLRIHESDSTRQLRLSPSATDLSFLEKCYGGAPSPGPTRAPGPQAIASQTGQKLKLHDVYEMTFKAAGKWKDLGTALHMDENLLEVIEVDGRNSRDRLMMMLKRLLEKRPNTTWTEICAALRNEFVERDDLAVAIENRY